MNCSVADCEKKKHSRGLCKMHYSRVVRTGRVERGYATPAERFWRMVAKRESCWEWAGSKRDGYGLFKPSPDRCMVNAHRYSWEMARGGVPQGQQVLHRCDNRGCVNPDHLFLGTIADNMRDRNAKGRQAHGEKSGRATVGKEVALAIRAMNPNGERRAAWGQIRDLARRFNADRQAIANIWTKKTWRHL